MKIINLIAGIALLVGLSVEILSGDRTNYSTWYMWLQFTVCAIFIGDFLYNLFSRNTDRLPTLSWLFLLMSIPYLNILSWMDINLGRVVDVTLGVLPLLRSFVAMAMVVQWLVESKVARIFGVYLFLTIAFTYLSALIFYDYESPVNDALDGFGNALWWACMNVTTVGAAIFPVTAVGKSLSVLLPAVGMMFFPVFTIYVTDIYKVLSRRGHTN
jgi:voltage-gated potassium channel